MLMPRWLRIVRIQIARYHGRLYLQPPVLLERGHTVDRKQPMQDTNFELGDGETIIASYAFSTNSEFGSTATLTNRRLIILTKNSRESHPLNRIRSVRIEHGRNSFGLFVCVAGAGIGFAIAVIVVVLSAIHGSNPAMAKLMREGNLLGWCGFLLGAVSTSLAFVFSRGYMRLAVELESGPKTYTLQRQDAQLHNFVQKIEQLV